MKDCKLVTDYENGSGSVELSDRFKDADPLLRADILQDWIDELYQEYEKAVSEMNRE